MWRMQAAAEAGPVARFPSRMAGAVALLALAGCSAFGSSALQFTPATLTSCEGSLIVVHVRWDFAASTRRPVHIYISSPGGARKLWAVVAPKGEMDTGRWMHDGSTITVRDDSGRLLGVRTLEATSCEKSG